MARQKEDVEKYSDFIKQIEMIIPAIAGNAYARMVTAASPALSGLTVGYNDHCLPILDDLKARNDDGSIDCGHFT
jgi:hypothetical protein